MLCGEEGRRLVDGCLIKCFSYYVIVWSLTSDNNHSIIISHHLQYQQEINHSTLWKSHLQLSKNVFGIKTCFRKVSICICIHCYCLYNFNVMTMQIMQTILIFFPAAMIFLWGSYIVRKGQFKPAYYTQAVFTFTKICMRNVNDICKQQTIF